MGKNGQLCSLKWVKRKTWPLVPKKPIGTLRLVDLFCGCGGLTLGAWEAARVNKYKLDIRLAVDFSPDAIEVYRSNFRLRDSVARCADVKTLLPGGLETDLRASEKTLRRQVGKVDILVAGPPCQGHSDLNNHTRRNDPRNALYLRVIRAVEVFRPRIVLIENVGAIVHDEKRVIQRSLERLKTLGYSIEARFVHAEALGLPQRRRRHILLAVADDKVDVSAFFPNKDREPGKLRDYIRDIKDEPKKHDDIFHTPAGITPVNRKRIDYLFRKNVYDLPNHQRPDCHKNGHSYKSMYGRLDWNKPAQTITTGFGSMGQGRFVHPSRRTLLTPHEAARLQGFPDFYTITGRRRTKLQELLGNAVPPAVGAQILSAVLSG